MSKSLRRNLCLFGFGLLILAGGCASVSDLPPELKRGMDIVRDALDDPRSLTDLDRSFSPPEAFLNSRYGSAADYRLWRDFRADYERKVEKSFSYDRLGMVRRCNDEPLDTPLVLEPWARRVETAPSPLAVVQAALEAGDIEPPHAEALPEGRDAITILEAAALKAHTTLLTGSLRSLSNRERDLLPFLATWLCRTGGVYKPVGAEAPQYCLGWYFEPSDPFKPGEGKTQMGQPVPSALPTMTSVYHLLRSLAGEDIVTKGFTDEECVWAAAHPLFAHRQIDVAATGRAFAALAPVLDEAFLARLQRECASLPPSVAGAPGVEGTVLLYRQTAYGDIVIGGPESNRYTNCQAAVVIDVGGDDFYGTEWNLKRLGRYPLRVIIDLDGDDVYSCRGVAGPGAGVFGLSVLCDRRGDDLYCQGVDPERAIDPSKLLIKDVPSGVLRAHPAAIFGGEKPASLDGGFAFGAALFGIGVHIDAAGDDIYLADKWCMGAAMWPGAGILLDEGGSDIFVAGMTSLGDGINKGVGILRARGEGDDLYQCWGVYQSPYTDSDKNADYGFYGMGLGSGSSWRGEARDEKKVDQPTYAGGIGLLCGGGGNDTYVGSTLGMAAGYAGGVGVITDGRGNDTYLVMKGEKGFQGPSGHAGVHSLGDGCHRGTGMLLDREGNDTYSGSNASGGYGWDISAGFLIDLAGDDTYTDLMKSEYCGNAGFGSGQAGAQGVGVVIDGGGADTFTDLVGGLGSATFFAEGYPGPGGNFCFGILLGAESRKLSRGIVGEARSPVILRPVAMGKEKDGKEYPRGIGVVVVESLGKAQ